MNNIFDNSDNMELLQRYNYLISKYVELARDLAPKLDSFGKIRQELQAITIEFVSRDIVPENSETLVSVIEKELQERQK